MTIEEYKKQKLDEYFDNLPINGNDEYYQISKNTVGKVINMPVDEYMEKNNCHSYEEIKERLGLEWLQRKI